MLDLGSMFI